MKRRKRALLLLGALFALAFAGVVGQFLFLGLHTSAPSFEKVIGFPPPEQGMLLKGKTKGNHFDGKVEWLYDFPRDVGARWTPPSGFTKLEDSGASSKYAEVLWCFEDAHPELKGSGPFLIWVGGRDGNAYIVVSANGRLAWFYFFWT